MDIRVLVEDLKKNFQILQYKEGTELTELAMSAGEQRVINYIARKIGLENVIK